MISSGNVCINNDPVETDKFLIPIMSNALDNMFDDESIIFFNGCPRTKAHKEYFNNYLLAKHIESIEIVLDISDEVAIGRISNRRICQECNSIYTSRNTVCSCGAKLRSRVDDASMDTILHRLNIYRTEVQPLIKDGYIIDAKGSKEEVCSKIKEVFSKIKWI